MGARRGNVITQQLRRAGNSYVVTIPKEEVERRGWQEGQLLSVELTEMELRPVLRPAIRELLDARWEQNKPALDYLATR